MMISTLMSGYAGRNFASFGQRIVSDRMLAGRDPNGAGGLLPKFTQGRKLGFDLLEPRAHGVKQIARLLRVGATLRVVRVRSRSPSRSSSPRIVWLNADCETPSRAAALVKLRSLATARNASRSLVFWRAIHESIS